MKDQTLATAVAEHKAMFFAEKDANKVWIDYASAVAGAIAGIPGQAAARVIGPGEQAPTVLGLSPVM